MFSPRGDNCRATDVGRDGSARSLERNLSAPPDASSGPRMTVDSRQTSSSVSSRDSMLTKQSTPAHSGSGHFEQKSSDLVTSVTETSVTTTGEDEPIAAAVKSGDINILSRLISTKVSVETKDADGLTPLMVAVRANQEKAVNFLI